MRSAIELALYKGVADAQRLQALAELEEQVRRRTAELTKTVTMLQTEIDGHTRTTTALQESEQRISEVLEFNKCILATSSVGILVFDGAGQCVFANNTNAEIVGTDVAGLLSLNFHQLQSWKESGLYETALRSLNTNLEQQLETHVVTTFGKDIWLDVRFSSFQSKGIKHLLAFTSDISEKKQAEEMLRKMYDRLEQKSKKLQETNIAFKILMQHQEVDRKELEKNMLFKIKKLVLPYLEKAKEISSGSENQAYLALIETNLNEIIAPFAPGIADNLAKLTPAELKIADLIKQGRSTKEIATLLNLSPTTIATHRRKIRRKTGLTNSKINLVTLLSAPTE